MNVTWAAPPQELGRQYPSKFSFINLIKLDHHWRKMMLQKLNVMDDSCESTFVLKKKADILSTSYDISIHQWLSNIFVDVC